MSVVVPNDNHPKSKSSPVGFLKVAWAFNRLCDIARPAIMMANYGLFDYNTFL